jgi:hypothetical protein
MAHGFLGLWLITFGGKAVQIILQEVGSPVLDRIMSVTTVSVLLIGPGVIFLVRAPFLGVTCTHEHITVHGALWGRRIPLKDVIEIRQGFWRPFIRWRDKKGRTRKTPIRAFTTTHEAERKRWLAFVKEHNDEAFRALVEWFQSRS